MMTQQAERLRAETSSPGVRGRCRTARHVAEIDSTRWSISSSRRWV